MNDKKKPNTIPKTIPGIIKAINDSNDMETIETMENYIGCYYGIPVLLLGAMTNFILHHEDISSLMDSIFMLFLSFGFIILPYLKLKTRIKTHIISILYSCVLIFVTLRTYTFIGPAIWSIAFINIIISSLRVSKIMLNYVTISTLFVGMYYSFVLSKTTFEFGTTYYVVQLLLFTLVIIIAPVVHLINQAHYNRVNKLYINEVKQREVLEEMYDNAALTHKELQLKYNELNDKNAELKRDEEKLYQIAHFDMVTELPNRKAIMDKINELIESSKNGNISFYTAFIDIDSFKKINDTMGHYVGDIFMKKAAQCLSESIDKEDFLGRIGGDEFALIINRTMNKKEAYRYLERIRKEFLKPIYIDNNEIKTSASFGVAHYPDDGVFRVEIMKNADTAMYKAKELGKNKVQFFESSMKMELLDKVEFETELRSALTNEEFFLTYQPIYDLQTKSIRGFETLVRWDSKKLGIINPDRFIPIAEELDLIIPLGEWIIKTACKTFKEIQTSFGMEAVLSINISVKQLESSNIIELIDGALNEANLEPKYLEIEVTESILMNSIDEIIIVLNKLKNRGIRVSLDDFGTGYSSLNYLRKLPIDILKIDKSFIDDLLMENKNVEIIGSIIKLAHNLGILVIAEGIEEEVQVTQLMKLRCDYIQGFFIGKPMREDYLEKFIVNFQY